MERRAIVIRGLVQGVGFRPFVSNLATRLALCGFVKNQTGSVLIEVEGTPDVLEHFLDEVARRPPPLAQIDSLNWELRAPVGDQTFRIEHSDADGTSPVFISPDVATCADCLTELFDPADRRYRYPFLNCTNCGPRLTIITGAPYDRHRTTMASFTMCDACRAEYEDPTNRRFHAQPTACADCGPRLSLLDASMTEIPTDDPVAVFAYELGRGKIGAVKGIGGYHLACAADNDAAVAELRRRKHRDEKPFAIMVADVSGAERLAEVRPVERDLLESPQCPIVLLRRRTDAAISEGVAPRNPWVGVMLPSTPLHHLLLSAVDKMPLVMTSGNRSDEPIVYEDGALDALAGIADLFLVHNREIHVRCDDSVTRVIEREELPVRRSRGYAPRPIDLPFSCARAVLAVGGQLKGTFALGRDRKAFLSHHMGDMDRYSAFHAFEKDIVLYQQLFGVSPECVVHDLHADYVTSRYARERAAREGIDVLAVQHHHAHLASCMAENGLCEPVIGVTFDGTGFGTDGAVWGGEFLIGDYTQFERAAHLRYVHMPGSDQAIREPWRMAVAHLWDAGADLTLLEARILLPNIRILVTMLERHLNAPFTSSAGRLFDAVASLAGVRDRVGYEGQAAVELEWLATQAVADRAYPFALSAAVDGTTRTAPVVVDTRPVVLAVAEDVANGASAAQVARRFHSTMVDLIGEVCDRLRESTGIETIVLSGGVFLNALLSSEAQSRLAAHGFRVYRHRLVPPNDGGLSLGQLAVAAARIREA